MTRPKTRDELLIQLADHIGELVDPIEHTERYGVRSPTGHRRVARVHRSAHPCLLDQLAEAAGIPITADRRSTGLGARDQRVPAAAANLDAIDRLVAITAGLRRWTSTLKTWRYYPPHELPSTKADLRAFVGAVANARVPKPQVARLAADVARWRNWCRVLGAWEDPVPHLPTVPCPHCDTLPDERAGLRIRIDRSAALCLTCHATWDDDTIGLLAEHIRGHFANQRARTRQRAAAARAAPPLRSYGGRA